MEIKDLTTPCISKEAVDYFGEAYGKKKRPQFFYIDSADGGFPKFLIRVDLDGITADRILGMSDDYFTALRRVLTDASDGKITQAQCLEAANKLRYGYHSDIGRAVHARLVDLGMSEKVVLTFAQRWFTAKKIQKRIRRFRTGGLI